MFSHFYSISVRKLIITKYPNIDITLINIALDASKFEPSLAESFLDSAKENREEYFVQCFQSVPKESEIVFVSRYTQTKSFDQDLIGHKLNVLPFYADHPKERFVIDLNVLSLDL